MKRKAFALLSVVLVLAASQAFALTGTEIADKAHEIKNQADSTHMAVKMELVNSKGNVDTTYMIEEWTMDDSEGLTSTLMIFRKPASVANTRFLQKQNQGRGADKWMYLPSMKKVRRIAAADGGKSFMGTDMTYDDMEVREVARDSHELVGEEKVGQWDCYKVKAKALDPKDSQYSYRITWFDKETFYPIKVEMFDKKSEKSVKVLEVKELKKISDIWTPVNVVVKDLQNGHSTRVMILKAVYDEKMNPKMFTTNFLKQGR